MLSKINTFGFQKNYTLRKKNVRQNCLSQEDIQIYFMALLDRTLSFRFNCKKTISRIKMKIYVRYEKI